MAAAILTAIDRHILGTGVQDSGICRVHLNGPDDRLIVREIERLPRVSGVGAAIRTALGSNPYHFRLFRVEGDAARLHVFGQADIECGPFAGIDLESIETPITFGRVLATPVCCASVYISTHDVFPSRFGDEDESDLKVPLA
jgi:hypothetical protein